MRLKNWLYLFWTTLAVGAVSALAAGMYLQAMDKEFGFLGLTGIGFSIITMVIGGFIVSIISQTGFFAYLTVNYIVMSMIRKKFWWNGLQIILAAVVLFDLGYLRYLYFNDDSKGLLAYMGLPVILLIVSLIIAFWKVKLTNRSAFIPTLFFISVGTVLEAVPALRLGNTASTVFVTVPLLACNAWQILKLHKLVNAKKNGV